MVMQRNSFAARRRLLAAAGVGALAPWMVRAAPVGVVPRVVVLDWGLAAQLLAMGVVPVGMARPPWYRILSGTPAMPDSVVDVGLLFQPNFEVVQALRPDVIVVTPEHEPLRDALGRIARVFTVPTALPHEDGYRLAVRRARALGEALGRAKEAGQDLDETDAHLQRVRSTLASRGVNGRPVYLISPIDTRLTAVFGRESLFGGTLEAVGLTNAWHRTSDAEGMAQIDYTSLGVVPHAQAMLVGTQPRVVQMLGQSPLWQALPFVHTSRWTRLREMMPSGGTPTALRLADALLGALAGEAG